nr:hypothetical protein [Tanacetum cinerariifolium]
MRVPNIVEPEIRTIEEIVSMADRTMEELLQVPTEGYGEAIVIPKILEENFEIKTNLLQDVPNDAIKLMLFPYSLEGAARIWYEKEPPNSILTWDDLCMRTRSNFYPFNSTATIPRRSNRMRVPNIVEPEIRTIEEIVSMADRTMEELLQVPTEGYEEAIVIPKILEENFEIKMNLLQDVPNDAIKLMLFSYSLEGAA